jgi:hypothetical protein
MAAGSGFSGARGRVMDTMPATGIEVARRA